MSDLLRLPAILLAMVLTITTYVALGGDAGLRASHTIDMVEQTA